MRGQGRGWRKEVNREGPGLEWQPLLLEWGRAGVLRWAQEGLRQQGRELRLSGGIWDGGSEEQSQQGSKKIAVRQ